MCSCRRLILICYAVYVLPVLPKPLKRQCTGGSDVYTLNFVSYQLVAKKLSANFVIELAALISNGAITLRVVIQNAPSAAFELSNFAI